MFGGNPEVKSSSCGGIKAAHGVVKVKGPVHELESPGAQIAFT